MDIAGKVIFHRGEVRVGKGNACICCGDPEVPHAHIHGETVDFPEIPSLFAGLTDKNIQDYLHRFIHLNMPNIEGKIIKVTFEIQ